MSAAEETADHKLDPNYAVVCSFLELFGKLVYDDPSDLSISNLDLFLESQSEETEGPFVKLHRKLLRGIGYTNFTSSLDPLDKSLIRFSKGFPDGDDALIKEHGYSKIPTTAKLRILKNLCEDQFVFNDRFNVKTNDLLTAEGDGDELRHLPLGQDKLGRTYWYTMDTAGNMRLYRSLWNDNTCKESWRLLCSEADDLKDLIDSLESYEKVLEDDPECDREEVIPADKLVFNTEWLKLTEEDMEEFLANTKLPNQIFYTVPKSRTSVQIETDETKHNLKHCFIKILHTDRKQADKWKEEHVEDLKAMDKKENESSREKKENESSREKKENESSREKKENESSGEKKEKESNEIVVDSDKNDKTEENAEVGDKCEEYSNKTSQREEVNDKGEENLLVDKSSAQSNTTLNKCLDDSDGGKKGAKDFTATEGRRNSDILDIDEASKGKNEVKINEGLECADKGSKGDAISDMNKDEKPKDSPTPEKSESDEKTNSKGDAMSPEDDTTCDKDKEKKADPFADDIDMKETLMRISELSGSVKNDCSTVKELSSCISTAIVPNLPQSQIFKSSLQEDLKIQDRGKSITTETIDKDKELKIQDRGKSITTDKQSLQTKERKVKTETVAKTNEKDDVSNDTKTFDDAIKSLKTLEDIVSQGNSLLESNQLTNDQPEKAQTSDQSSLDLKLSEKTAGEKVNETTDKKLDKIKVENVNNIDSKVIGDNETDFDSDQEKVKTKKMCPCIPDVKSSKEHSPIKTEVSHTDVSGSQKHSGKSISDGKLTACSKVDSKDEVITNEKPHLHSPFKAEITKDVKIELERIDEIFNRNKLEMDELCKPVLKSPLKISLQIAGDEMMLKQGMKSVDVQNLHGQTVKQELTDHEGTKVDHCDSYPEKEENCSGATKSSDVKGNNGCASKVNEQKIVNDKIKSETRDLIEVEEDEMKSDSSKTGASTVDTKPSAVKPDTTGTEQTDTSDKSAKVHQLVIDGDVIEINQLSSDSESDEADRINKPDKAVDNTDKNGSTMKNMLSNGPNQSKKIILVGKAKGVQATKDNVHVLRDRGNTNVRKAVPSIQSTNPSMSKVVYLDPKMLTSKKVIKVSQQGNVITSKPQLVPVRMTVPSVVRQVLNQPVQYVQSANPAGSRLNPIVLSGSPHLGQVVSGSAVSPGPLQSILPMSSVVLQQQPTLISGPISVSNMNVRFAHNTTLQIRPNPVMSGGIPPLSNPLVTTGIPKGMSVLNQKLAIKPKTEFQYNVAKSPKNTSVSIGPDGKYYEKNTGLPFSVPQNGRHVIVGVDKNFYDTKTGELVKMKLPLDPYTLVPGTTYFLVPTPPARNANQAIKDQLRQQVKSRQMKFKPFKPQLTVNKESESTGEQGRRKSRRGRKVYIESESSDSEGLYEAESDGEEYDYDTLSRRIREARIKPSKPRKMPKFIEISDEEIDVEAHRDLRKSRRGVNYKDEVVEISESDTEEVVVPVKPVIEKYELQQYPCTVCNTSEKSATILTCEDCDSTYHMGCLTPPILLLPEYEWLCPLCEHQILIQALKEKYKELRKILNAIDRKQNRINSKMFNINRQNIMEVKRSARPRKEVDYDDTRFDKKAKSADDSDNQSASESDSGNNADNDKEGASKERKRTPTPTSSSSQKSKKKSQKIDTVSETEDQGSTGQSRYSRVRKEVNYDESKFDKMVKSAVKDLNKTDKKKSTPTRAKTRVEDTSSENESSDNFESDTSHTSKNGKSIEAKNSVERKSRKRSLKDVRSIDDDVSTENSDLTGPTRSKNRKLRHSSDKNKPEKHKDLRSVNIDVTKGGKSRDSDHKDSGKVTKLLIEESGKHERKRRSEHKRNRDKHPRTEDGKIQEDDSDFAISDAANSSMDTDPGSGDAEDYDDNIQQKKPEDHIYYTSSGRKTNSLSKLKNVF